ncbi:MAG: cell division protein ZapA [Bacteroidetes bacterium]|nr:cell division protein ZapA [Bacteroidota bacterium]MBS1740371.1 cell division protein ZapA [Bacteroidota bacterium]
MEHDNLLAINVWLAGRSYRIRIKPEEEEAVRLAIKQADNQLAEMRTQYAGKDDQDFLAMVLLTYATESVTDQPSNTSVRLELKKMIDKLDYVLKDPL